MRRKRLISPVEYPISEGNRSTRIMTKPRIVLLFLFAAVALQVSATPASAFNCHCRFKHCETCGDYKPPKGVIKWYTVRIKKEWEHRVHCLPCGRKEPYKVKVITYRDRYSDGTQRTWKCVVAGSETPLGPATK